jgi:DNA repair exonuclease SbcCD ATPase subunit
MQRAKGRYCLVPLKEGGKDRELSAFRQLMNFTFEIAKTDTKGLTETFATIIESGKINQQDKLHQDLQSILDDYNGLRQSQDKLKNIGNYAANFKRLREMQRSLDEQQRHFGNTFGAYSQYLGDKTSSLQQQKAKIEPKVNKLSVEQTNLIKTDGELQKQDSEFKGQLTTLNKDITRLNQDIERFEKIQAECPDLSVTSIRDFLQARRDDLDEKIGHLEDTQKAIDSLAAKVALQKSKINSRKTKSQAIEQTGKLLISKLDQHSATVLANLNPHFAELMVEVDDEQGRIIGQFGQLFSTDQSCLYFLGEQFSKESLKSPQQFKEQLQQDLDKLEIEIQKLDNDILDLQKMSKASGEYQQAQLQKAEQEMAKVKKDLMIVNAIESTQQQWQAKTSEVGEINDAQQQLARRLEEAQGQLEQNRQEYFDAKKELESLTGQITETSQLSQRLQQMKPDDLEATAITIVNNVTASDISQLEGDLAKLNKIKESLNQSINEFVQCGHFQLPVEIACSSYSNDQQRAILTELNNIFAALPHQLETLQSRIIEHNKMTGAKISELTANRTHIGAFINKVNKQFEHYSISNLQAIRVEIELDDRFEELVNELDRTNLNTTDIHDDALYQRLNAFCEDFFTGGHGNRILEMSRIIKNVRYSYKKANQDKREDKDQSTGTNALINCTLLTILLGDLLAQDSKLMLPVIFDEFTALDPYNQRTAIKAATEHGFALFCASPTDTAEVVSVVDYYIHLDDFHANTIYDASGERDVVFHRFHERLYDVVEQA